MITPYDYQSILITSIRDSFRTNRAVLGVLPTGGGKTVCFTYITQQAIKRGSTVWIIAHRKELITQASKTLTKFGVKHGVISPHFTPDYTQQVQVASVQTLANRMNKYRAPDLIIVDEAHHSTAGQWKRVIDAYPTAKILGVTATPERSDGIGLGDIYDDMKIGPQIAELIQRGFLVEPIVYRPPTNIDLSAVKKHRSDYVREDLAMAMNKPTITGDAVEHYRKLAFGLPAVVFCVNVQHCKDVAREFQNAGFSFYAVDGSMDQKERDSLMARIGTPEVLGLVSCDIISEGTDIPAIGCAIMLRPTNSVGLYIQQIGRALRTLEGKENAIILDHVGNTIRHGMPTMNRNWSLEGRKARMKMDKEADISTVTCESCYGVFLKRVEFCPYCNSVMPLPVMKSIQSIDGTLERVTDSESPAPKPDPKERQKRIQRARTREQLLAVATDYGYSVGWVNRMIESRERNRVL